MELRLELTLFLDVLHVVLLSLQPLGFKLQLVVFLLLRFSIDQEGSLLLDTFKLAF